MWSALENMAFRESLPTPLLTGDAVHGILIKGQLVRGRHHLHHLGYRRSRPYILKQYYSLDTDAFLRWQNEARFIELPPISGYVWPDEEWRGGLILPHPGGVLLSQWLQNEKRSKTDRLTLAARLTGRLARLHEAGIAHRRLSPDAISVVDGDAVIINFGHARRAGWDDLWTDSARLAGDRACSSPELLASGVCNHAEDVHALGTLLHLLLLGKPAYGSIRRLARAFMPNLVRSGAFPNAPELPGSIRDHMISALARNPLQRPTASELAAALADHGASISTPSLPIKLPSTNPTRPRAERYMVFVKDDPMAISLFDQVLDRAGSAPGLFLFVGFIPNNLPSGHYERFKGRLFRKLGHGLARCRAAGVTWSLRVTDNAVPHTAARALIRDYAPDRILLGQSRSNHRSKPFGKSFETRLAPLGVPIESIP